MSTGFNGLSIYATDVDSAIAEADRVAAGPRPLNTKPISSESSPEPVHTDRSGLKKAGWALAVVAAIAIYAGANSGSSPPSSSSTDTTDSTMVTEVEPDAVTETTPATDDATITSEPPPADDAPITDTSLSSADSTDTTSLSKPTPGQSTLTMAELRYCIAEDIRVSAQKSAMDKIPPLEMEKFNRNVDAFNEAVNSFNTSCSRRSYNAGSRPDATAQVEQQRSTLEAEGRARVE